METERKSSEVSSGRFSVLMVREKVTICLYLSLSPWSHSSPFVPIPYRDSETRARVNTILRTYTLLITLINSELSLFSFKCLFVLWVPHKTIFILLELDDSSCQTLSTVWFVDIGRCWYLNKSCPIFCRNLENTSHNDFLKFNVYSSLFRAIHFCRNFNLFKGTN